MSTIAVIALVLTALWLALLTLVVVVLVRQTAILGVHLQRAGSQLPVGSEGLDVGRAVPQMVLDTVPEAQTGPAYVVITSATCRKRTSCAASRSVVAGSSPQSAPRYSVSP